MHYFARKSLTALCNKGIEAARQFTDNGHKIAKCKNTSNNRNLAAISKHILLEVLSKLDHERYPAQIHA